MNRRLFFIALAAVMASAVLVGMQAAADSSQTLTAAQLVQFANLDAQLTSVMDPPQSLTADPPGDFHGVSAHRFDPGDTDTAQAKWEDGTGCLNAVATHNTTNPNGSYTDSVCATAYDPKDEENDGLLLEKGGPTPTNSAGTAELHNVKGTTVTELGYDIRLLDYPLSVSGSHCGAGAPRFDIYITDGTLFFVGCRSPLADSVISGAAGSGDGWTRLQWGTGAAGSVMGFCVAPAPTAECPINFMLVPITGTVQRAFIVFDEGTDTASDYFGAAFLDNINYNGQLVGKG
jgi:hypothetical protein